MKKLGRVGLVRRSHFAAACLLTFAPGLAGCLKSTHDEHLGGKWFIRREISNLAEAGGVHPFLHRRTRFSSRRVAINTYRYRYLGDDCVLFEAENDVRKELMAACGEHDPVRIADTVPSSAGFKEWRDAPLWKDNPVRVYDKLYTIQEIEGMARR